MADVQFDKRFPIAEATRGSWVPIDSTTITNYPTGDSVEASRGRYAQLNYIVGVDASSPGASATNPNFIQIVDAAGDAVTVDSGSLNVRITDSVTVLSAFEVDATGVSGLNIRAEVTYPDTSEYQTVVALPTAVTTATFTRDVNTVEVFNNDILNTVYVSFNNSTINTLSSQSIPLLPESFYSIDRQTDKVYIGNVDSSDSVDVRVVGHYRNA